MSGESSPPLSADQYISGVRDNHRVTLARAITLIENDSPAYRRVAGNVLNALLPETGGSFRVGITGPPGAGKSTLIENLGNRLIDKGLSVAVLAVDPSSTISRGSILGDKTRMGTLANQAACFIRPSPSGGALGGVARKSRETILLCEAAGYDVILVETVGVGQNEITVRSMVDFFLLVLIPGSGDTLQGIKRGVIELADTLVINKADGRHLDEARRLEKDYALALQLLAPATEGWETAVQRISALHGEGVQRLWSTMEEFRARTRKSGVFERRRRQQKVAWFHSLIEEGIKNRFYDHREVREELPGVLEDIEKGDLLPTGAAERLLRLFGRA